MIKQTGIITDAAAKAAAFFIGTRQPRRYHRGEKYSSVKSQNLIETKPEMYYNNNV